MATDFFFFFLPGSDARCCQVVEAAGSLCVRIWRLLRLRKRDAAKTVPKMGLPRSLILVTIQIKSQPDRRTLPVVHALSENVSHVFNTPRAGS